MGTAVYEVNDIRIRVTNLLGRVFMQEEVKNPFDALNEIIENEEKQKFISLISMPKPLLKNKL